jgi:nucleotide-binding universal stress UspA family protein
MGRRRIHDDGMVRFRPAQSQRPERPGDLGLKTPEGDPGGALTDIAAAGDLIVVGRGEPGLRRVLHGSVGRYCRTHSPCPVVVVPARYYRA